jgi:hypothetical protein
MDKFINERVIVRARGAGVFYGTLKAKDGDEVLLADARRIYRWNGASECIELAQAGCSKESKITRAASEVIVENVLEIHPCTAAAVASIDNVPVWKYR